MKEKTGTGFVNGAVVTLDGAARTTTFGSATQLSATILASDVASAGTHIVAVTNPAAAGGGGSNGRVLTVATPATVTVSPASVHWTAVSNQTWLTVSPPSGDGSGAVMLTAAAKVGKATKNATVTIGGLNVTVKQ